MIQKLPNEILHKIFAEIDSTECWSNLRLVSSSFKNIIESRLFWIQKLSYFNNISFINDKTVKQMVEECIIAENELKAWKSRKSGIGFALKNAKKLDLYAFVDCAEIILCDFGYLLFVGSRDKSIRAWNLKDLKTPFLQKLEAHSSWIKHLAGLSDNKLLSFGYEGSLTFWDIQYQHLQIISTISLKSTVLDYEFNSSNLFTISVDNIIRMISLSSNKITLNWTVKYFKAQTTAITCSNTNEDTVVYCASKNGWIASLNSNDWRKLDSSKLEDTVLSMKFFNNKVYCGLADGNMVILSPTLKILKKIQVLSARISINQIFAHLNCIICVSNGGSIVVFERKEMKEIFRGSFNQQIITVRSKSNHLLFISNNGSIYINSKENKNEFY